MPATPEAPHHPYQDLIGFETSQADEAGTASVTVRPEHMNPNNVCHGAVPYALIDTAMGSATMTVVPEGGFCATIEIHIRYFKAVLAGGLHATATVRRAGKRIVHLDATVVDDDGVEIAAATGSYAVIAA